MFEAVGLLKILALSALATRNFAKSRIPKDKKILMFLRCAKHDSLIDFLFFFVIAIVEIFEKLSEIKLSFHSHDIPRWNSVSSQSNGDD